MCTDTHLTVQSVSVSKTSAADGSYSFANLKIGQYNIIEVEPDGFKTTVNTPGMIDGVSKGTVIGDVIASIDLANCHSGVSFNFGEIPCVPPPPPPPPPP